MSCVIVPKAHTQARWRRLCRPSLSVISAAFMAFCTMGQQHTKQPNRATYRKILLVGEDQEECIAKFVFVQHALQLFTRLNDTIPVVGINNEDDTLSVLEVVAPQRPNFVLSSNIPDCELDILVLDCLNVEAWTWVSRCACVGERISRRWHGQTNRWLGLWCYVH